MEYIFTRNWFRSYLYIIIGTLIMAVGYVYFIIPYKIVPGGIYGISIVLHYLLGTPIGLVALAFNIPLTIVGIKILGLDSVLKLLLDLCLLPFTSMD